MKLTYFSCAFLSVALVAILASFKSAGVAAGAYGFLAFACLVFSIIVSKQEW